MLSPGLSEMGEPGWMLGGGVVEFGPIEEAGPHLD